MAEDYQRIEVITGTARRRSWSTERKLPISEETLAPGETISSVGRRNGVAPDTREFATALNLVPCFTPVRSPESNGMSEAFVKTFKRDYLRINPLPDAPSALRQIAGWIIDHNEIHPHSALRMRSPREFIRAQAQ